MKILAVDCCGLSCSVALWAGGQVLADASEPMIHGQATRLVPMMEEVMSQGQAQYGDIDLFAVTTGPGGFTGLRVGIATVRGLALATGKPALGLSSFDVAAGSLPPQTGPRQIILESRRAELYSQIQAADGTWASPPSLIDPTFFTPPAGTEIVTDCPDKFPFPTTHLAAGLQCATLAQLAAHSPIALHSPPTPLYLHPPQVSTPKPFLFADGTQLSS
jgi:tRNA threonylcarbamoyladenosine biosynthesis protein TsaB